MQYGIIEPRSRDPLTALPRRDYLRQRLAEDCAQILRVGDTLSLLAIDLDHFTDVNASYFIPGGDQVLAEIARLLRTQVGPNDLVVRDGGDQFTVVLYGVDRDAAASTAERIREIIAATPFAVRSRAGALSARVTVSIGVATFTPDDTDAWNLFERARMAVHKAKASGRNRVATDGPV